MVKKKFSFFCLILTTILLLSACGEADEERVIIDEATGEEIVISAKELEEKEQELVAYSEHLSSTFNTSMELQDVLAHSLDELFMKELSAGQFANILKTDVINQSREILDAGEKYNFPSDYFDMNQMVVSHLNNQHQLYLDAVNEATNVTEMEGKQLNIHNLRSRLAELKQEYLTIVNTWKNGGKVQQ